ncbi:MAG TPA: DUF2092 domain-containing protein [Pirellulales bacterium]|nr:DUF2092 domain-containing protein [Pirellulales bacterium]
MRSTHLAVLFLLLLPMLTACGQQPPADAVAQKDEKSENALAAPAAGSEAEEPADGQPASDEDAGEAKAIVRQLADFYREKQSIQVDFSQEIVIKLNGMEKTLESQAKIAVERPNRIAIRNEESELGVDVVCDGEQLSLSVPALKKYSQSAAPESLAEILKNPVLSMGSQSGNGPMLDIFSDDPYSALMKGVNKAEYAGREKVGDLEVHHLKFEQDQFDWEMWVAADAPPRLVQVALDLEKSLAASGLSQEQLKDSQLTSLQKYEHWKFDAPLDEKLFAFEPPADAEKVDSFFGGQAPQSPLVGKPAPDVEQELLSGKRFSLKALRGKKIVILDFWATWCGPCVEEMPLVAKVAEQYRDKDVALYCVNQGEEPDEIRSFLDAKGLKVTVSLDPAGQAASAYGVEGIPMLVLIDKAGVVQSVHVGFRPDIDGKLKAELDAMLAGKKPSAETESEDKEPE